MTDSKDMFHPMVFDTNEIFDRGLKSFGSYVKYVRDNDQYSSKVSFFSSFCTTLSKVKRAVLYDIIKCNTCEDEASQAYRFG